MANHMTKGEEELMNHLWSLEKSFFKELKDQYKDPKPATTTINTLLKRLIDKGIVNYRLFGNSREYYPLISKEQYYSKHLRSLIKNSFNNSIEQFASFFTREVEISDSDLKKLRDIVDTQLKGRSND
ncbi:BlaI/MecI/CopY family transcriptional regulator [Dyadobacter sp. CY261]|uniref:BlaI/MecI/CopY family transcriptional regulator n=1 Tax=Dyadobacter sp. CY261 TaxID=2907203 RepID=UPI001F2DCEC5|nr:BlaI/MecI/CopY family transcriptional regulator [Dyadobacter sp. CY261]MCF0069688.1 BlaI/MecI/CopY family transcriptional regulator [Dyadobacter sp. CY261]